MSRPTKEYLAQYRKDNRDKLRAQQIERDRKKREAMESNPELRKEYLAKRRQEYLAKHPGAKTKEEYNLVRRGAKRPGDRARKQNKPNVIVEGFVMRVCDACNHTKPLETGFPRHGTHGRKGTCNECSAPVSKPARTKKVSTGPKFVISTERKPTIGPMPKTSWDDRLKAEGWVKLLGESDIVEWMGVYVRRGVILYVRGRLGSYSIANQNYGVMFDDTGKRYHTLGAAEKVAQRMQA